MIITMDYLGGANYGAKIKKLHPIGYGAGFILNTNKPFWPKKNAWPVIEQLAVEAVAPLLRAHAQWEDSHQYKPEHNTQILRELEKTNAMCVKYPHVKWLFSPFCERDNDSVAFDKLWEKLLSEKHIGVKLVNSVNKAKYRPGGINEFHGGKGKPPAGDFGYSFDGKQCWDRDIFALLDKLHQAEYIALWLSFFNGKWNDKAKGESGADVTPRDKREAWPYKEIFSWAAMVTDMPTQSMSKKHLWKSHADQHGPERQPREGKPVFITPIAVPSVELRSVNGHKIGSAPRSGSYTDGRPMYRFAQFGYQYAKDARDRSGSPMCDIVANNKVIGRIHPAFRAGDFRPL